jgi:ribonuclease VapC
VILFVDASAIVAMIAKEPDALEIADRLDEASRLLWSPVVKWEAVVALARLRDFSFPFYARDDVSSFGKAYSFELVPIGEHESELAFDAFRLYGKNVGHPAKLNMGDCFSYACAKSNQAKLLYKGNDFVHTDLA